MPSMSSKACLVLYVLIISAFGINVALAAAATSESDKLNGLPGQPAEPALSQFSGYITVEPGNGRALFYWFFEAMSLPSQKPLLLWLNGGPGCSSIGYGAASELGPLRVDTDGTALIFNKYSWNQEANLLFVESPVGVGFSYTNTSSDLSVIDDAFVAEDAYNFLVNWLQRFPQYMTRNFFISGESYAGHYIPQLAELIYDRNKDPSRYPTSINLKGFIAGNPETDDYYDSKGLLDYAWSHAVISDQLYNRVKSICDFKQGNWSAECNQAMSGVYAAYNEIDFYNIYAPTCLINSSTTSSLMSSRAYIPADSKANGFVRRMRIPGGYDPCYSAYAAKYFNRPDVQSALRIGTTNGPIKWEVCNNKMLGTYNYSVLSVLPIYTKLIKGGLEIWIYSGDVDGRVPVTGSRYWLEALGLLIKSPWRSWYHDQQVAGRILEYDGVTFVTVRGAGHLVPLNKPGEALALIHSFLSGEDLQNKKF